MMLAHDCVKFWYAPAVDYTDKMLLSSPLQIGLNVPF